MKIARSLVAAFAMWLLIGVMPGVSSAMAASISFHNAGGGGGGYGNSLTFSSGAISVTARAFSETGAKTPPSSNFYQFQTAEIYSWSTGLGICNRDEGLANISCDNNEHEVDTVSRDDMVVLLFNQTVNFHYLSVDPWNGPGSDPNDRDLIYWVANVSSLPNFLTQTFDTIDDMAGISAEVLSSASSSFNPYTHTLSGSGNMLILAGNYHDRNCKNADVTQGIECEAYKISDIMVTAAPAPVPGTLWLFGSALGLLGFRRRFAASRGYPIHSSRRRG